MLKPFSSMQVAKAKSADSFVDTIGINTHVHYRDTVYEEFETIVQPRLTELQIRYIRDIAVTYDGISEDSFYYNRLRTLADDGIKFNLLTSPLDTSYGEPTNYDLLDEVYEWTDRAVVAFEGVNEPDVQGVNTWIKDTQAGQRELYETVNAHPLIKHIPVISPSLTSSNAREKLGDLSEWTDYGNIHNYWAGRAPESKGWGAKGYGSFDWHFDDASITSGSDPIISTETGWRNDPSPTQIHQGTPETLVARYIPRLFLSQFNAGIERTYLYQLIDQGGEDYGLLARDNTPKPAFKALKNLIGLFNDPNSTFTPGSLAFDLSGDTENIQHSLFQKSNGDFYLALWVGEPSAAILDEESRAISHQSVTLTLPNNLQPQATIHTFQDSGNLKRSTTALNRNEIDLALNGNVKVLQLTPTPPVSAAPAKQSFEVKPSFDSELSGAVGQAQFTVESGQSKLIRDFGGVGRDANPSQEKHNEVDTLKFVGAGHTADKMQLTQRGPDLAISFKGKKTQVTLKNFALDQLENLPAQNQSSTERLGNITFSDANTVRDSFDVFNADFQTNRIWNRNHVTFLNGLDNTVEGFNDSNDVINGQGGNDVIKGLGGNDRLRGNNGNDRLIGSMSKILRAPEVDQLEGGAGADIFQLADDSKLYYSHQGNADYALIEDFNPAEGDVIQLLGKAEDYRLGKVSAEQGTGIFQGDELVGIVAVQSGLNLASASFQYGSKHI
ncbi:MAG: hypothetical protein AAF215_09685 [Cyanobacteria bacterium P01_A01_bin.123]